jgi:hypothetical protein
MADIKVERFEVNVSSNGQTYTLANDVGSLTNAFVRMTGPSDKVSAGPIGSTSNAAPNRMCVGVQLTATNTLTFYLDASDTTSRKVMGEVWRYTGPGGGAYEFQVNDRGSLTIASGNSSQSASTSVSNRNNAIPIYTGYTTDANTTGDYDLTTFALHINSSSQIVASKNNSTTGHDVVCYYEIPEFTGSAWNVGHAFFNDHDDTAETVTMNTDSTGVGGSTFDVTDWETATILDASIEADSNETGIGDCLAILYPAAGTTQLTYNMHIVDVTPRNDGVAYAHILQCADLVVKRDNSEVTEGNNSYGNPIPLPSGVNALTTDDEISLSEWYVTSSGTGTAHGRGRLHATIQDTGGGNEIINWVHRSGNLVRAYYAVSDFSGMEDTTPPPSSRRIISIT